MVDKRKKSVRSTSVSVATSTDNVPTSNVNVATSTADVATSTVARLDSVSNNDDGCNWLPLPDLSSASKSSSCLLLPDGTSHGRRGGGRRIIVRDPRMSSAFDLTGCGVIAGFKENLYKLDDDVECFGSALDRLSRRLLRVAVHGRDVARIRQLNAAGVDVNTVISDVFGDTPLTYAVKYGYLEVVETVLSLPGCRVDQLDRNKRSALDEAIRAWLVGAADSRQNNGRRFRIVRCLLEAEARQISTAFLDVAVFSALGSSRGRELVRKLAGSFREKGGSHVKSVLLSVLVSYGGTAAILGPLIASGARPSYYRSKSHTARLTMPLENALVLLRACARSDVIERVDSDARANLLERSSSGGNDSWPEYSKILRILTLSGRPLQMSVVNHLYRCHADAYRWLTGYRSRPRPLLHLARDAVRRQMADNVSHALTRINTIPKSVKRFLIFSDVGV